MKKVKNIGVVGHIDTGKSLLTAIEIAKEKEREIIIVGLGNEVIPKTQTELIQLSTDELVKNWTEMFELKPSKRDKYKKKFHK